MLKLIKLALISCSLLSLSTNACDIEGKSGFMPDNNMYIGVNESLDSQMTEETFNQIIDRVAEVFEPIVKSRGGNLQMVKNWQDGTVNAYANQSGSTWSVHMFGGLARHQMVSNDGFALVVCHELGHHLAGAPKVTRFFTPTWASNEGQSDYFASMKCFRRVYGDDDNQTIVSNMKIDDVVAKKCENVWDSADEIALCKRVSQASQGLATLLNGDKPVSFSTPDTSVVAKTNHQHPKGQCRLDTYFSGALCKKDIDDETSNRDPKPGYCNRVESIKEGVRPLCWYKP